MHKLLQRQLKKTGAVVDKKFLDLVDQAYRDADTDRELLERSLEISSQEMRELYDELQKSSQQKIKKSEERLVQLMNALHDQYFWYSYDLNFKLVDISDSVTDILGYTPQELVGKNFRHFHMEDPVNEGSLELTHKILQKGEVHSAIVATRHKNGSVRYLEVNAHPLFDEEEKIYGAEGLTKDITQQYFLQKELDYLSNHDQLTGLLNRHSLYNQLEYIIKDAKRNRHEFSLFYIDLDNFKLVNDSLGHDEGDRLLKNFAKVLQKHIRTNDLFARIGGDEFVIVFTNTDENIKQTLADKILQSIQNKIAKKYKKFNLSASIGIATYPKNGVTAEDLLKSADRAMYSIKHSGKNSYAESSI